MLHPVKQVGDGQLAERLALLPHNLVLARTPFLAVLGQSRQRRPETLRRRGQVIVREPCRENLAPRAFSIEGGSKK